MCFESYIFYCYMITMLLLYFYNKKVVLEGIRPNDGETLSRYEG